MDEEIKKYLDKAPRFSESGELYQGLIDGSLPSTRNMVQRWGIYGITPNDLNGKTILDLGCNIGGFSAFCQNHCKNYLGIDIDPLSIDLAKYLYKFSNCDFQVQSILDIPKSNYDIIFAFAVRHYTELSFDAFVFKMASLLCPGGVLYYESHGNEKVEDQKDAFETLFSIIRTSPVLTVDNGVRLDYRFFSEMRKK